jgi:hypothetical protein
MPPRRGVTHMLEAQVRPLTVAIPRFIQLTIPLPLLRPMAQSRRGVPVGAFVLSAFGEPHAAIEPSALRAAKAYLDGEGAPTDSGYTNIYSTQYAFAALKADGSITAWGHLGSPTPRLSHQL